MLVNGKRMNKEEFEAYLIGLERGTNTGRAMALADKISKQKHSGKPDRVYAPTHIQRLKNGVINNASLEAMKYVATKPANDEFQAMYIVRNSSKETPRVYMEIKKWDKEQRRYVPNMLDPMKISLASLMFYDNIETMFDDIKEIETYETFTYVSDTRDIGDDDEAEELSEYIYDDGYSVNNVLSFVVYKASFAGREIAYTRRTDDMTIMKVESWLAHEAHYKSRNKYMSGHQSLDNLFENYERALNRQTDQEMCIGKHDEDSGVYSPGYCMA